MPQFAINLYTRVLKTLVSLACYMPMQSYSLAWPMTGRYLYHIVLWMDDINVPCKGSIVEI